MLIVYFYKMKVCYYIQSNHDLLFDALSCDGANDYNLFPSTRLGSLDVNILKKLGVKKKGIETNGFLFFYQLILSICDKEKSGINGDKRISYYAKVEEWSNMYAHQFGLEGSYEHEFEHVFLTEPLQHDRCIVRDLVL